jgi:cell division protein FtsQ
VTVLESAERFTATRRKRRWRRWAIAAAVVLLAALAVWLVWFSSVFSIREVRVLGAVAVDIDEVRRAAAVPPGQQLARADVAGISARVGAIPRVAAVEVRRGWPNVLVVVVTERTAIAVVRDPNGLVYIDPSGARFGSASIQPRTLPLLVTTSPESQVTALAVVHALPPAVRATVAQVVAHTRDDVVLTLRGGADVRWGSSEDAARKLTVLRALLHLGAQHYDVSAPDLPTTRGTLAPSEAATPSRSGGPG